MNPVTFLLAAAILVALHAGFWSWVLFGVAAVIALTLRAAATLLALGANDNANLREHS